MLGNNRIAGLFTVLFISNACHNLLQQPKPRSILSFIATFVQAENCTEYGSVAIIGLTVNKILGYNALMLLAMDK